MYGDLWGPACGRLGHVCLAMCTLSLEPRPQPLSGGFSADTAHSCAHTHTSVYLYLSMYMTAFTHKHIWTRFVLHASPGTHLIFHVSAAPLQGTLHAVPCCPGRSVCHQSVPDSPPSHTPRHTQAVVNNSQTCRLLSQLGSFLTGSWPQGSARGSPGGQIWGWKEPAELLAVPSVSSWRTSRTRDIIWGDLG